MSVDRANQLRAEAAQQAQTAETALRAAQDYERANGIHPPCFLCGRRECDH